MNTDEAPELWMCSINGYGISDEPLRLIRIDNDKTAELNDEDDPNPLAYWSEDGEEAAAGPGLREREGYTEFVTASRTEALAWISGAKALGRRLAVYSA